MNKLETHEKVFNLLHAAQPETRRLGANYLSVGLVDAEEFTDYILWRFFNEPRVKTSINENIRIPQLRKRYFTQVFLTLVHAEELYIRVDSSVNPSRVYYYYEGSLHNIENRLCGYVSGYSFSIGQLKNFLKFLKYSLRGHISDMVNNVVVGDLEVGDIENDAAFYLLF